MSPLAPLPLEGDVTPGSKPLPFKITIDLIDVPQFSQKSVLILKEAKISTYLFENYFCESKSWFQRSFSASFSKTFQNYGKLKINLSILQHVHTFWGDITSCKIRVPPFVTPSHLLGFPPPSLSRVTSFMDGPLCVFFQYFRTVAPPI